MLGNLSVLSLTAALTSSPLFTSSLASTRVSACRFSRSFRPIFHNPRRLFIDSSHFRNFLSPAIRSENTIKCRITDILTTRTAYSQVDIEITITGASFQSCVSDASEVSGGAISIDDNYGFLFIEDSYFHYCRAKLNGGAVHVTGCPTKIVSTCFDRCSAGENGQTIHSIQSDSEATTQLYYSTSLAGKYGSGETSESPLYFSSGRPVAQSVNLTMNTCHAKTSGVHMIEPNRGANVPFRFTTIASSLTGAVLRLEHKVDNFRVDACSFVNNTAGADGLIAYESKWLFNGCEFVNNKGKIQGSSTITFRGCVLDFVPDLKMASGESGQFNRTRVATRAIKYLKTGQCKNLSVFPLDFWASIRIATTICAICGIAGSFLFLYLNRWAECGCEGCCFTTRPNYEPVPDTSSR